MAKNTLKHLVYIVFLLSVSTIVLKAATLRQGNETPDSCYLTGCPGSEDGNGNGILDINEDTNANGVLDEDEDKTGSGILGDSEDINGNNDLDTYDNNPIYLVNIDNIANNICGSTTCQLGKVPDNPFIPETINQSKLFFSGKDAAGEVISLAGGVINFQTSYSVLNNYLELNVIHQDATTSGDAVLMLVGANRNGVTINNYKYLAFTVDENNDGSNATGAINLEDDDGGSFDSVIKVEADNVTINNYNDAVINALDKGVAIKILGNGSYINQSGSNGVIKSVDTAILIDNSAIYTAPTEVDLTDMDDSDFSYNHKINLSGFFSSIEGTDGYAIYSLDGTSINITTTAFTTIKSTNNDAIRIEGKHHFINITNGSTDSLITTESNKHAVFVYGDDDFENKFNITNPYSSATISAGAINEDTNKNNILDAGEDINANGVLDIDSSGSIAIFSNADEFILSNSGKITAYESALRLGDKTSHFTINALSGSEMYLYSDGEGTAIAAIDIQGAVKGGNITVSASSSNVSITAEHATDENSWGTAILVKNTDDVTIDISGASGYKANINGSIIFESGNNINITLNENSVINTDRPTGTTGSNSVAIDIANTTDSSINLGGTINGDILLGSNSMVINEATELNGKLHMGTGSSLDINGTLKGQDDAIDGSLASDAEINFTCISICDVNLNIFKDIENTNFKLGAKVNLYASTTGDVKIKNLNFENKTTLNLYENSTNGNKVITFNNINAKKGTFNLYYTELYIQNELQLTESSSINIYASGNKSGKLIVNKDAFINADSSTRVYVKPANTSESIISYSKDYEIMKVTGGAGSSSDYEFLFQDSLVVYEIVYEDNGSDLDAILKRKLYSTVLNDNKLLAENSLLEHNTTHIVEYLDEVLIFDNTQGFQNSVINGIDSQATSEDNVILAINSINPQDMNFLYIPAEQSFTNTIDSIDNHLKYTMLKSLKDRRWIIGDISTASFQDSYGADQKITTLSLTGGYDIIKNKNNRTGVGASLSFSSSDLVFNVTDNVKNNMFALSSFIYNSYMPSKFYVNSYLLFSMYGYNTERDALYNKVTGELLTANHFRAGAGNVIETGYVFGSLKSKYLNVSIFNEAMFISGSEYDESNSYNSTTIDYNAQKYNYTGAKLEFVYLGNIIDVNSQEYKLSASLNSEVAYNLLYEEEYNYNVSFTSDPNSGWSVKYYNSKDKIRAKAGADINISDGSVTINFGYDFVTSGKYIENNFNIKAYKSF